MCWEIWKSYQVDGMKLSEILQSQLWSTFDIKLSPYIDSPQGDEHMQSNIWVFFSITEIGYVEGYEDLYIIRIQRI